MSTAVKRQDAEGNNTILEIYSLWQEAPWEINMNRCSSGDRWVSSKWYISFFSKSFYEFDVVCLSFYGRENMTSVETERKKVSARGLGGDVRKETELVPTLLSGSWNFLTTTAEVALCRKLYTNIFLHLFCNLVYVYLLILFYHTSGFSSVILRQSEDFLFVYHPSLLLV